MQKAFCAKGETREFDDRENGEAEKQHGKYEREGGASDECIAFAGTVKPIAIHVTGHRRISFEFKGGVGHEGQESSREPT